MLPRRHGDRGASRQLNKQHKTGLRSASKTGPRPIVGGSGYPTKLTEPRLGCGGRRQERGEASRGTRRNRSARSRVSVEARVGYVITPRTSPPTAPPPPPPR